MRRLTFELVELPDGWYVTSPQIPGFHTDAPTIDETLEMTVSLLQDLRNADAALWLGDYADAVTNVTRVTMVGDGAR